VNRNMSLLPHEKLNDAGQASLRVNGVMHGVRP
jgi:hypothetical protein